MDTPKISLIVAMGKNREIGRDNKLLIRIPDDLKRFRSLTMGHAVVMGRKTWQSLGHALPVEKLQGNLQGLQLRILLRQSHGIIRPLPLRLAVLGFRIPGGMPFTPWKHGRHLEGRFAGGGPFPGPASGARRRCFGGLLLS